MKMVWALARQVEEEEWAWLTFGLVGHTIVEHDLRTAQLVV